MTKVLYIRPPIFEMSRGTQISNFGGLELILTIDKSRRPNSRKSKKSWFWTFFDLQPCKMDLISVGSSSYFEKILLTWLPTRISIQIFNFGGLELILTIDKSKGPNSSKSKTSWFLTIFDLQPYKMYLIPVGSSSYFEEILLTWFRKRISTQIFNFGGLDLIFNHQQVEGSKFIKIKNIMIFDLFWPTTLQNVFNFSRIKLIFWGNTFDMVSKKNLYSDF